MGTAQHSTTPTLQHSALPARGVCPASVYLRELLRRGFRDAVVGHDPVQLLLYVGELRVDEAGQPRRFVDLVREEAVLRQQLVRRLHRLIAPPGDPGVSFY